MEASEAATDFVKRLANDPLQGLHEVQTHIRGKAIRDAVERKEALLRILTSTRETLARGKALDVSGSGEARMAKAAARLRGLSETVDSLRERLEIVSSIQDDVKKTSESFSSRGSSKRSSFGRWRKDFGRDDDIDDEHDSSLPVGVGQHLDNTLMNDEVDVDQYVEELDNLVNVYSQLSSAEKKRSSR